MEQQVDTNRAEADPKNVFSPLFFGELEYDIHSQEDGSSTTTVPSRQWPEIVLEFGNIPDDGKSGIERETSNLSQTAVPVASSTPSTDCRSDSKSSFKISSSPTHSNIVAKNTTHKRGNVPCACLVTEKHFKFVQISKGTIVRKYVKASCQRCQNTHQRCCGGYPCCRCKYQKKKCSEQEREQILNKCKTQVRTKHKSFSDVVMTPKDKKDQNDKQVANNNNTFLDSSSAGKLQLMNQFSQMFNSKELDYIAHW